MGLEIAALAVQVVGRTGEPGFVELVKQDPDTTTSLVEAADVGVAVAAAVVVVVAQAFHIAVDAAAVAVVAS